MALIPSSNQNVFGLYRKIQKLPFAMSRHNWKDRDFVVVLQVVPKGKYGAAYGFAVHEGEPNDHLSYNADWKKCMELPNAGSYQWRHIDIPEEKLNDLIKVFYQNVAPQFGFMSEKEDSLSEDNWIEEMK